MQEAYDYDVGILGTGIAGSLLGAILARQGLKVVLIDRVSHPKFAIGESTVPETTTLLHVMAERYDVPELDNLSNFHNLCANVTTSCGVKRSFSFVHHREGEPHRAEHSTQFPTWAPPFGPDVHFFRQDVDAYLMSVAVKYGAVAMTQHTVTSLDFQDDGVTLDFERGKRLRVKFVADASGFGSPLCKQLALHEKDCGLRTNSRTIFTHMIDVPPYDAVGPTANEAKLPYPFFEGTLHHLWKGGWYWIIPFDNHVGASNPLCSVGVCINNKVRPPTGQDPEEEFNEITAQLPSVARHLKSARAVRPWVTSPRMQYRTRQVVGDRFCLLQHSAGFIDPLFSTGMQMTMHMINNLAYRVIDAVREDSFSRERFEHVETWFNRGLDYYDRLVACSYITFRDFDLWNAWHRVWIVGSMYGLSGKQSILAYYKQRGDDPEAFKLFEQYPYRAPQAGEFAPYARLFDEAATIVESVGEGALSTSEGTRKIYELLEANPIWPKHWKIADADARFPSTFTLGPMLKYVAWGQTAAPAEAKKYYFTHGNPRMFVEATMSSMWSMGTAQALRAAKVCADIFRQSVQSRAASSRGLS